MNDGFKQVERQYGVVYKKDERVTVNGKLGVITGCDGQYLRVLFDGQTYISNCHPTWRVKKVKP